MIAIVNVTPDWGIGCENHLLVSVSADLRRFRALTEGKTVILGRKTMETFPGGRPLKNRRNIVLSRQPNLEIPGAEVAGSLESLFALIRDLPQEEVCVIGGGEVYRQLLPYCSQALLTCTDFTVPADRFFPDLTRLPGWEETGRTPDFQCDGLTYRYIDYVNRSPLPLG